MEPNIQLLIIDPQNDFCDLPESWRPLDPISGQRLAPALPVPGAHADMLRLAELIGSSGRQDSGRSQKSFCGSMMRSWMLGCMVH